MSIESPFEILELEDGETIDLLIESYEVGETEILLPRTNQYKTIKVLRAYVPRETKQFAPWYWDITSTTLIYQLEPELEDRTYTPTHFRITKHGVAPRARFSVEVVPLGV